MCLANFSQNLRRIFMALCVAFFGPARHGANLGRK